MSYINLHFVKCAVLACAITILPGIISTEAAVFVWDGGGTTDNWNDVGNWNPDGPVPNGSDLQFDGNTRLNSVMNATTIAASLSFNSGAGQFVLSSTGTFSFRLGAGGLTNNSSFVQTINLTTMILSASQTWHATGAGLIFGGTTIDLGGNTLTLNAANSVTIGNRITGTTLGGLIKNGSGVTSLFNTNNTYSGATTVNAGTLRAGAANTFSTNSVFTVNGGGLLDLNNFNQTIANLMGSGNISLGSGTLTLGGNNGSTTFSGNISGTGGLTKNGTGILALSGVNTYSGFTTINAGTLRAEAANSFSAVSRHVLGSVGTLDLNGFNQQIGALSGNGAVLLGAGTLTFGNTSSLTYSGTMSGTGGLTKVGTGTQSFNVAGALTYSGPTTINAGTFRATGANAFSPNSTHVVNGGTLSLNNLNQTIGALAGTGGTVSLGSATLTAGENNASTTNSSSITGTGSLTKTGTGNLSLTGNANTYSGGTVVANGTLTVNNTSGSATGTGSVNVNNGATIGGAGIIAGNLALNAGSTVSPGNSAGTLTVGSSTWNGGATYIFEINSVTGTPGVNWDLINSAGAMTLNATSGNPFVIALTGNPAGFDANQNYSWNIASFAGNVSNFDASAFSVNTGAFAPNTLGGTFAVDLQGNQQVNLTFTAVPEPSTMALAALGVLTAGIIRRRAKK